MRRALAGLLALLLVAPSYAAAPKRVPVAQGGTNLGSGTSGGVLGFTASGVIASSGALTLNLPVIGGGAGATPASGARSGNTTTFGTTSGALTNGHCLQVDANGNIVDAGGACSTGSGGGTVTAGLINQLAWYSSAGTVVVGLTTANNGVLVTSGGGVPSIATTLPSGLTIPSATLSSPTMTTPALGTPASGVGTNLTGLPWAGIVGTPTTLSGYGITNALTTSLTNTDILVGNGSNNAAAVALSGDATLANTGAITVTKTSGVAFGTAATVNTGTSGGTIGLNNGNKTDSGNNTSSGNNTHSGAETFTGTLRVAMRTITAAGAVTVSGTADYYICINKTVGAATTVNLPATPATGLTYLIKDCKGDAATNNIVVTPAAGNIDGTGSFTLSNNFGSVAVTYTGTIWSVN